MAAKIQSYLAPRGTFYIHLLLNSTIPVFSNLTFKIYFLFVFMF